MHAEGSLNKVGDATAWMLTGGISSAIRVAVRNISGGTVKIEKKANGSIADAAATSVVDIVADQTGAAILATETTQFRYRARCTVAPTAGGTIIVRLSDESAMPTA